jgi:hypothetical protein
VKAGNPFKQIRVQPAAKLDRLETVIVLLTQTPVEFKTETPGAPGSASTEQSNVNAPTPAAKSEKP